MSTAFSRDLAYAFISKSNALWLYQIETGREIQTFRGHAGETYRAVFSPDGERVLSGVSTYAGGDLRLWELAGGRHIRSLRGFVPFALSRDGRQVVCPPDLYGYDPFLRDLETGERVRSFSGHIGYLQDVAMSPDGRYILSGSSDKTVKLWDAATGREIRTLTGYDQEVTFVSFSPDGEYFLTNGIYVESDPTDRLVLYRRATGERIRLFAGYFSDDAIAFSPDSRYLATGKIALSLWDVATGEEIRSFEGHQPNAHALAFSPDGRHILSTSADHTTRMWDAATGRLLFTRLELDEEDWVAVAPDGRFDGSPDGMRLLHYAQDGRSIPLDALFEKFYTPDLIARLLSGEPADDAAFDIRSGIDLPPRVSITTSQEGQSFTEQQIDITVRAEDQGGGIDDIRLYHNGKLVGAEQRGLKKETQTSIATRTFAIQLLPGENTFRATAFSRDRTESRSRELRVLLEAPARESTAHLLTIGINQYRNAALNLTYARPDAEAIARVFQERSASLFRQMRPIELYDDRATREAIIAALDRLAAEALPQDVVVIYLAGHGETVGERFYFIPHELVYMEDEEEVRQKGVADPLIADRITRIEARKVLVLFDACKSGGALMAFRGAADRKALLRLARSTGTYLLAASTDQQYAAEFGQLAHGAFTYALLQGLTGEADGAPPDGTVTVEELTAYVKAQVPELTARYRGQAQYPVSRQLGQAMDFPIALKE